MLCPGRTVASSVPYQLGEFCPQLLDFWAAIANRERRQSLPHRQVLPVSLCCAFAQAIKEMQQKSEAWMWPASCDGFGGSSSEYLLASVSNISNCYPCEPSPGAG